MSKEILQECFALLDAEYGDKLTDQQRAFKKELFFKIIGKYPPEKVKEMTLTMIKNRKFSNYPKIAEMVEIIEGNKEEETELAWAYLLEQVSRYGYYYSVSFQKYPAIGGFIESEGGWINFCDKLSDAQDDGKEIWIKKEFEKSYSAFKKREVPTYFEGYFEIENNKKGYDNQKLIETFGMTIDGRKKRPLQIEGGKNDRT